MPNVKLNCFTATEVQWFEKISGLPASEILDQLMDAGLESLTGGGAEIFDWEVRQHIADHSCHWEDWSRIHRLAHSKGLRTPSTMLYGHIEEPRHRVDPVPRLRELQDETRGFTVFIPLRYQHDFVDSADGKIRNRLQARTTMASPAESLTRRSSSPAASARRRSRRCCPWTRRWPSWPCWTACALSSASATPASSHPPCSSRVRRAGARAPGRRGDR